jgi:hypothetical protein
MSGELCRYGAYLQLLSSDNLVAVKRLWQNYGEVLFEGVGRIIQSMPAAFSRISSAQGHARAFFGVTGSVACWGPT